ncbi:hypothetical protein K470DRAFT_258276 [Piedraia hortae CBS 480.64]|uniref:Uncharacterized protein n=1 Tax=Piedraia hortae CBS 480.64 TaxID=1314780 RepID=A0A6A7BY38_9PEZI|nr:hypothetical protein K470DRAFT_258276 [Piedraia hortae CBS 480.64]
MMSRPPTVEGRRYIAEPNMRNPGPNDVEFSVVYPGGDRPVANPSNEPLGSCH